MTKYFETEFACYILKGNISYISKPRYNCEFSCFAIRFKFVNGDVELEFYDSMLKGQLAYNEIIEELGGK